MWWLDRKRRTKNNREELVKMFFINGKWEEKLDLRKVKAGDVVSAKALTEKFSVLFLDKKEHEFSLVHEIERENPKSHFIIRRKPPDLLTYTTYTIDNKTKYTRKAIVRVTLIEVKEIPSIVKIHKQASLFSKGEAEVFYNQQTEEERIEAKAW